MGAFANKARSAKIHPAINHSSMRLGRGLKYRVSSKHQTVPLEEITDSDSCSQDSTSPRKSHPRSKLMMKRSCRPVKAEWIVFIVGFYLMGSFLVREGMLAMTVEEPVLFPVESPATGIPSPNNELLPRFERELLEYQQLPARIRPRPDPIQRRTTFEPPKLVSASICADCRLQRIHSSLSCEVWMHKQVMENSITISEAGIRAAKRFPQQCSRCDPSSCSANEKYYWPLDVAAPRVLASRSLRLNISNEYRIPESAFDDLESFFSHEENQHPYLWEWNPSIVTLPQDQIPSRYRQNNSEERPMYLATFRVSKQQNCFRTDVPFFRHIGTDSATFKTGFVDLVGIALLRDDFSVMEEGFFDLRRVVKTNQDLRLFVFPPEDDSSESRIYMSGFHEVVRLWLQPPRNVTAKRIYHDYFESSENPLILILEEKVSCCTSCVGKNFNYFMDENGKIMVETLPIPHSVEHIDLSLDCNTSRKDNAYTSTTVKDPYVPKPSYSTVDELYFVEKGIFEPPYGPEHGTACCITIPDPRHIGNSLLVGVSHYKTTLTPDDKAKLRKAGAETESRQYISRFYAFEPRFPYRLVATSGGFCMPFPSEAEFQENYNNKLVAERVFLLGETINCPYITFISGMTEKGDDPSKVLLAYGLNDCTARIAEVSKTEIIQMLFDPLSRLDVASLE